MLGKQLWRKGELLMDVTMKEMDIQFYGKILQELSVVRGLLNRREFPNS